MKQEILTLGIETSCDETAASVVRGRFEPLSNIVASQTDIHDKYGGIVPELACRRHAELIGSVVGSAIETAKVTLADIDLVAVTRGPGLVGALLVGLSYAKGLAWGRKLPLVGVNHLNGHITAGLVSNPMAPLPALCLLVSGGHTELYTMEAPGALLKIGSTRDDAAGEALDKVARMLGLGYPGGPVIEKMAKGSEARFDLPVALSRKDTLDFSFSGPKTAAKYLIRDLMATGDPLPVEDICASFQKAVIDALEQKTALAAKWRKPKSIIVAGGVACNGPLRERMNLLGERLGVEVVIPPPVLCSDNAVMIAVAGAIEYLNNPEDPAFRDFNSMDADSGWAPSR